MLVAMLAAGAVAGITAGLFGVGGGFIVVPALLTVFPLFSENADKHIYVAIGTSLATIIVSSVRAVQAHHRRGAVDFCCAEKLGTLAAVRCSTRALGCVCR